MMDKREKLEQMEEAVSLETRTGKTIGKATAKTTGGKRQEDSRQEDSVQENSGQEDGGQEDNGQEDNGQEDNGQEDGGQENSGQTENGRAEKKQAEKKQAVSGQEAQGQNGLAYTPVTSQKEQEAVIEAVLFTMGSSVELRQLAVAIGQDLEVARNAVEHLRERYRKSKGGMEITQLEDRYQMCTKAAYYENLIRVAAAPKKQVLTDVVLETLSIIAYKQPVTKMEIEKIRGVKSDHAVNRLVEYNLAYEVGRLDAPGRPALFATTEEFLRRFGVGSVSDLPDINPEQEAEIKAQVEEELQIRSDSELAGLENPQDATQESIAEDNT